MLCIRKYLVAGFLSAVPLWVTWLVVAFLIGLAFDVTGPVAVWLASNIPDGVPLLDEAPISTIVHYLISILLLFVAFYFIGWFTTRFAGRRLIKLVDRLAQKIPFVGKVYWGTKQVIDAFQAKPDRSKQVVLIEYPHPGMKTVGLVTKSLRDTSTGDSILAVYVPTTPNPTSGFLEMVPADKVVPVQWSVNDAIAFIVSGGSVGPEEVAYSFSTDEASGEENRGERQ